ncbi:hypothetical protein [Paenibacillus sp. SI8]|uniref:hypothetical protein n=1 Tax=unclassified Paenibacillus TaxID=185978 RepID=UPI003467D00A
MNQTANHRMLFGQKELADLLGITKQTLYARLKNDGGHMWGKEVPEPAYVVSATKLWTYEQIEEKIMDSSPYSDWFKAKERFYKLGQVDIFEAIKKAQKGG